MLRVTVVSVSMMFKKSLSKLTKEGCQRFRDLSKVEQAVVAALFQHQTTPQMGMCEKPITISRAQYAERVLNKTSKTLAETFMALILLA